MATTLPRAVTTPAAKSSVSTATLRPLISAMRPRSSSGPSIGVGFRKSTCSEPVTNRNGGSESRSRIGPNHRGRGGAGDVTIDQRGDQPAVDEAGNRGVIGLRKEPRHGLIAFPEGLDLMTVLVEPPAAVAVRDVFGVVVLKGVHERSCSRGGRAQRIAGARDSSRASAQLEFVRAIEAGARHFSRRGKSGQVAVKIHGSPSNPMSIDVDGGRPPLNLRRW